LNTIVGASVLYAVFASTRQSPPHATHPEDLDTNSA
jgi:hypothetical protein